MTLAAYLAELHDAGRASSSAAMAVAAACFRAKLAGQPAPAGERTARVLAGYRRTASDRNRGQARPFGISDLAAVLATFHRPRRRGCGIESEQVGLPETRNRSDPHLGRRHLPVDPLPGQRANDRMGRERLRTRAAQADPGTRSGPDEPDDDAHARSRRPGTAHRERLDRGPYAQDRCTAGRDEHRRRRDP